MMEINIGMILFGCWHQIRDAT